MNDELYKALSKGYADEVEQLNALELIETQQNSIMHRNDLLAELARNVEGLQAEVARLKAAIEPFADVSDFLASETEGLSDDDVFNLKLAGARFLVMNYTAKQFHDARAALAHGDEQVTNGDFAADMMGWTAHEETE
jgi:hypothetical protein